MLLVATALCGGTAEAAPLVPAVADGEIAVAGLMVEARVFAAIRSASERTGVGFPYLLAKAYRESGFDVLADAATSSAAGIYQFTRQTWLDLFRRHGEAYGQGALAQRIVRARGQLAVPPDGDGRAILDLRHDPVLAAQFAAEYTRENRAVLSRALGRSVSPEELYIAHFLGAQGALTLLRAAATRPEATAASILPDAAAANRALFYPRPSRTAISAADLHGRLVSAFRRELHRFAALGPPRAPAPRAPAPVPGRKPEAFPSAAEIAAALAGVLPGGGFALPWTDAGFDAAEPARAPLAPAAHDALLREAVRAVAGPPPDYGSEVAIAPLGWSDAPEIAPPAASLPDASARAAWAGVEAAFVRIGADRAGGMLPRVARFAAEMPPPVVEAGTKVAGGAMPRYEVVEPELAAATPRRTARQPM